VRLREWGNRGHACLVARWLPRLGGVSSCRGELVALEEGDEPREATRLGAQPQPPSGAGNGGAMAGPRATSRLEQPAPSTPRRPPHPRSRPGHSFSLPEPPRRAAGVVPGGTTLGGRGAFEEAATTVRRSRDPVAYRGAIELYAGELLPEDRYEEWAEGHRKELRRTFFRC
jgi:hypothetical protein